MHITIAERLRPYQHTPGTRTLLPGTNICVQVFPTLVLIDDYSCAIAKRLGAVSINIEGPVKDFTVQLDLEKGLVLVWGFSRVGYFRYAIVGSKQGVVIHRLKEPAGGLKFNLESQSFKKIFEKEGEAHLPFIEAGDSDILEASWSQQFPCDRLSLGNHKAQDWGSVARRGDLTEIFPVWFRLGQMVPESKQNKETLGGTAELLEYCRLSILERDPVALSQCFKNLFCAGFEHIMAPTLFDGKFLGFNLTEPDPEASPSYLLSESAKLIRSLFFREHENGHAGAFEILPLLPPEFHCGRILNIRCGNYGLLDLEWSKKLVRRMILNSEASGPMMFTFQSQVKQFRLRLDGDNRGIILKAGETFHVQTGKTYFFDRFEK